MGRGKSSIKDILKFLIELPFVILIVYIFAQIIWEISPHTWYILILIGILLEIPFYYALDFLMKALRVVKK